MQRPETAAEAIRPATALSTALPGPQFGRPSSDRWVQNCTSRVARKLPAMDGTRCRTTGGARHSIGAAILRRVGGVHATRDAADEPDEGRAGEPGELLRGGRIRALGGLPAAHGV